jgi:hypothetical protein
MHNVVFDVLAAELSREQITEELPDLEPDDIRVALMDASRGEPHLGCVPRHEPRARLRRRDVFGRFRYRTVRPPSMAGGVRVGLQSKRQRRPRGTPIVSR